MVCEEDSLASLMGYTRGPEGLLEISLGTEELIHAVRGGGGGDVCVCV